jgi:hypothetical protein
VSLPDIESYLGSKGLDCKSASAGNELLVDCWTCGKDKHLSVNVSQGERHGLWRCLVCGASGHWNDLRRHFGDVTQPVHIGDEAQRVLHRAAQLYHGALRDADLRWLEESRGLTPETVKRFGLGYAPGGIWLYSQLKREFEQDHIEASGLIVDREKNGSWRDLFESRITIPYFLGRGVVVNIKARDLTGTSKIRYMAPQGAPKRLFNSATTWKADEIVICEGEFDAIVLDQLGFRAIGIPGATSWDPNWTGYLQDAKRVWILCDPDPAGVAAAEKLKEVVGSKARILNLPVPLGEESKNVDPTYLVTRQGWTRKEFDELFQSTRRVGSLLIDPMDAYQAMLEDEKIGGLMTGYEVLDTYLQRGIRRSNLFILQARTNVGKTLGCINFETRMALHPDQGDLKFLHITLEQQAREWLASSIPVWNYYHLDCDPADAGPEVAKFWAERLRLVDKNRLNEQNLMEIVEDYECEMGQLPDVIVVDYLQYLAKGFAGPNKTEQVGNAVQGLKALAKEFDRPVISPVQAGRVATMGTKPTLDTARDSGEIENTADIVLSIWSTDLTAEKSSVDRTGVLLGELQKTRGPGKGRLVRWKFAPLTLTWIPDGSTAADQHRAAQEISWDDRGEKITWQEAIIAHRTGVPPRGIKEL